MSEALIRSLSVHIHPTDAVGAGTRAAMFRLLARCFEDADEAVFEADLGEKDTVILLTDPGGEVQGFTTSRTYTETVGGAPVRVLFSGDTLVAPEAWGTPLLHRAWVRVAMDRRAAHDSPLWWMLICSGYRTYRYLPLFFQRFWPRFDETTPGHVQAIMDGLATARYGARYEDGVVRIPGGRLRPGVSEVPPHRERDPHVAHFLRMNPGHARGDELVCLAEFHPGNFTRALDRLAATVQREGWERP